LLVLGGTSSFRGVYGGSLSFLVGSSLLGGGDRSWEHGGLVRSLGQEDMGHHERLLPLSVKAPVEPLFLPRARKRLGHTHFARTTHQVELSIAGTVSHMASPPAPKRGARPPTASLDSCHSAAAVGLRSHTRVRLANLARRQASDAVVCASSRRPRTEQPPARPRYLTACIHRARWIANGTLRGTNGKARTWVEGREDTSECNRRG